MSGFIDLTGKVFGRLTVLHRSHRGNKSGVFWLCRCQCGVQRIINGQSLNRGATVSCGCRMRETITERIKLNTTHGAAANGGTRTFHSWNHMKARCTNPKNPAWKDYGGRGIKVCEQWLESFTNFLNDMGECPKGKSIDRFPDKNGNYEPGNCRWATPKQQANNRRKRSKENRNAIPYTYNGLSMSLKKWAEKTGISRSTIWNRIKVQHLSIGRALELE